MGWSVSLPRGGRGGGTLPFTLATAGAFGSEDKSVEEGEGALILLTIAGLGSEIPLFRSEGIVFDEFPPHPFSIPRVRPAAEDFNVDPIDVVSCNGTEPGMGVDGTDSEGVDGEGDRKAGYLAS